MGVLVAGGADAGCSMGGVEFGLIPKPGDKKRCSEWTCCLVKSVGLGGSFEEDTEGEDEEGPNPLCRAEELLSAKICSSV